jgi:hypothetical protein
MFQRLSVETEKKQDEPMSRELLAPPGIQTKKSRKMRDRCPYTNLFC